MQPHPYTNDPDAAEAERLVREMMNHAAPRPRDYIGRRRRSRKDRVVIDGETMRYLVVALVARWHGDNVGHDNAAQIARLRLYEKCRNWEAVNQAIADAEPSIVAAANVEFELLRIQQAETVADLFGSAHS